MKQFEYPVCELVKLTTTDVIRTSCEAGETPDQCMNVGME